MSCTIEGQTENQWELGWSTDADTAKALWSGIYADPTNSAYVYATGTRFWASSNTGTTFTKMSGPHADHHGFATDPVDPKIIYTACDGGIYRSPNRGASDTWTFIGEGLTNVEFYDTVNAVTQSNLYIGGTQDNGTIQYDGSSTIWEHIRDGDGATVDIDPTDAGIPLLDAPVSVQHFTQEGHGELEVYRVRAAHRIDLLQLPFPGPPHDAIHHAGLVRHVSVADDQPVLHHLSGYHFRGAPGLDYDSHPCLGDRKRQALSRRWQRGPLLRGYQPGRPASRAGGLELEFGLLRVRLQR